jgi:LysM repeat protein
MRRFFLILGLLALFAAISTSVMAQQTTAANEQVYIVQRGDTLYRLSVRFGVPMATIAARNGITNFNLIYVGQRLVISGGTTPPPTQAPGQPPPQGGTYVIQRGDTLARIAARFGTTWQELARINNIANPNLIYAGQTIRLPGGSNPGPVPTQTGPIPTAAPGGQGGFELGGQVFSFSYPQQMKGAGMTWAKSQVVWDGSAGPNIAQGAINAARSNGFKILLSIVGNQSQIAANPTQYYQNFANFLAGVARLNPDGIEVWNEQNIDREWPAGQINGASYAQMLSAAYQAIKNANPNVLVISGAPAPTGFFGGKCAPNGCDDDIFIRQMAQAGTGNFADCIGLHYNEGILPPTSSSGDPRGNSGHYSRYYPTMVNLYASVFPNKSLCFTELGYLSPEGYGPLPASFSWAQNTKAQDQALWLSQAAQLARASRRVRLMIVWNVDSTTYGADPQAGYAIIRPNNTCPACVTLGAVMK